MNILVCVKQVPDMEGRFVPNTDESWHEESGLAWRMNDHDTFAVEQALLLREQLKGGATVTVLSIGAARVVETIRKSLAMGCVHGVHIEDPMACERDPWQIASMIAGFARQRKFDLVFTGMQSEDRCSAQVGVLVAERLGYVCVTGIIAFAWQDAAITVERELEGGRRCTVRLKVPALLTCQPGLNTPRYPTLPFIMKSKRAVIEVLLPESVGLDEPKVSSRGFRAAERKAPVVVLEGESKRLAVEVVSLLEQRGVVTGRGGVR
ncbi:MAG: electron transfer flavoprotein subunit beta/FixA family protein [Chlorobiaceae bacterium]|nr:electron transfer flavoprotein subunit beta/FixA family protein [Chlorobiaceae bacterium]